MNIRINRNNTVHASNGYGASCSSDRVYGFRPVYRETTDPVTCKKCLKLTPAPAAPAPAPQPEEAPAGHIRCEECDKHIPYNMKAITAHAAECF